MEEVSVRGYDDCSERLLFVRQKNVHIDKEKSSRLCEERLFFWMLVVVYQG